MTSHPIGDTDMANKRPKEKTKIDRVEVTSNCLTDRAGLSLFARYLVSLQISPLLIRWFGSMRKKRKGIKIIDVFTQLFCFFFDGTSFRLTRFDELRKDDGYAATIETKQECLASSHQMKRFFESFSFVRIYLFRKFLQKLFIWRLRISQPEVIVFDIDTMVMDNDDADVREGVQPTYKKKKGFQPLQMTWGRYVVDAVFRGGKKHSNHSDTVIKMVRHMVKLIRTQYRSDVPILLTIDSGFFDEVNFKEFEKLNIGYISGGRVYADIRKYVEDCHPSRWKVFHHELKKRAWEILSFGDCRGTWNSFRRALFCRPLTDDKGQGVLSFARKPTVLYTNIGRGFPIDDMLRKAGLSHWLTDEEILLRYHGRGASELVNRSLKDFGTEHLPFKRFESNAAFYYTMLVAFNLFEAFKEDVTYEVMPIASYATTVRRKLIDIAGKIVRTGGEIILKIAKPSWQRLNFEQLWEQANLVPVVALE